MSNYSNPNNQSNSGIPWWLVILAFVLMWPAGVVLLILKLNQEGDGSHRSHESYDRFAQEVHRGADEFRRVATSAAQTARDAAERVRRDAREAQQREAERRRNADARTAYQTARNTGDTASRPQPNRESERAQSQPNWESGAPQSHQSAPSRKWGKVSNGFVPRLVGGILAGTFAFCTLMVIADGLATGLGLATLLTYALPTFIGTGVGAGLFTYGQIKKNQGKRFKRYLNLIGDQERVSISDLAAAFPARHSAVVSALEDMIDAGIFGDRAWIDFQNDELVLDGSGLGGRKAKASATGQSGEEHALLRQIRQVNAAIADPEMTRKIDRITEITERILEFQREHPEKAGELRKFLNYYLPTTLKILSTYAELEKQGVEGQNIAATKQRIEGMMDMVVEGFERQLDKLFAGDMMDIAADITVMEQMMQGDGLFGQDDITGGMGGH